MKILYYVKHFIIQIMDSVENGLIISKNDYSFKTEIDGYKNDWYMKKI